MSFLMSEFPVEEPFEGDIGEGDLIVLKERTAADLWQRVEAQEMDVGQIQLSSLTMMMWKRNKHDHDVYASYCFVFPKKMILKYNIKSQLLTVEVPVEEVPADNLRERVADGFIPLSKLTMMMWTRHHCDPDVFVSYSQVFPKMITLQYNIKSQLLTVESPKGSIHEIGKAGIHEIE